jgi:hypothetical protein
MRAPTFLVVCLAALAAAPTAHAATFTVTTNADSGAGSLRAAILAANAAANGSAPDEIHFGSAMTITPASALPSITDPVILSGTDGAGCTGAPVLVALDGNGVAVTPATFDGITLASGAAGSSVCALNVRGFRDGIVVDAANVSIQGNRIGTNGLGTAADPNGQNGIALQDAPFAVIGGTFIAAPGGSGTGNLISGNTGDGIDVGGTSTNVTIQGNKIGTDLAGSGALPNAQGVQVHPGAHATVGSTAQAARNLISGNTSAGVNAANGEVVGNDIGVDEAGEAALENDVGVLAGAITVGGTDPGEGNVISGNDTIDVDVVSGAILEGNRIGVQKDGGAMLPSELADQAVRVGAPGSRVGPGNVINGDNHGVQILSGVNGWIVQDNLIGLTADGLTGVTAVRGIQAQAGSLNGIARRNTIGPTSSHGIDIAGTLVEITGNSIGLDAAGNDEDGAEGIRLQTGGGDVRVGGPAVADRNVVGGHGDVGIVVEQDVDDVTIEGNRIGVGADGTTPRPNEGGGIVAHGSKGLVVRGNVISENGGYAFVEGAFEPAPDLLFEGNVVDDNVRGLRFEDAPGASIAGNTITDTEQVGVFVDEDVTDVAIEDNAIARSGEDGITVRENAVGVSIRGNAIEDNGTDPLNDIGIDLDDDGPTANDGAGDPDAGANGRQNFPVVTGARSNSARSEIDGTLESTPNRTFTVEAFASTACDGSGAEPLGTAAVTTDGAGIASFSLDGASVETGRLVTATATDETTGATSELAVAGCPAVATMAEDPVPATGDSGGGGGGGSTTTAPPPPVVTTPPVVLPPPAPRFPAKIRVLRNGIDDGVLDMLIEVTSRAVTPGAVFSIDYESSGRHTKFTVPITGTQVKVRKKLPSSQPKDTGITTVTYAGNAVVGPDDVRLRAADGKSLLTRGTTSLVGGRLVVDGTVTKSARGVVRVRLGYNRPDGSTGFASWNAPIADGRWAISQVLTGDAARGGQLSIQFTGYEARNLRGEQTAKEVLP